MINTWAKLAAKQVNDSLSLVSEEVKDISKAIHDVKVASCLLICPLALHFHTPTVSCTLKRMQNTEAINVQVQLLILCLLDLTLSKTKQHLIVLLMVILIL